MEDLKDLKGKPKDFINNLEESIKQPGRVDAEKKNMRGR